jgi:chromosome segregation ATPase
VKILQVLEKLGLWAAAPAAPAGAAAAEPRPEKRVVSLEALKKARAETLRKIEANVHDEDLSLDSTPEQIYSTVGIVAPENGWTLERLAREAATPEQVVLLLAEHKLAAQTLLEDGVRRDQALDQFEEQLDARLTAHLGVIDDQVATLEAQAREILEKAERLKTDRREVLARMKQWRSRKHAAEDELERVAALVAEAAKAEAPKFSAGRKSEEPE